MRTSPRLERLATTRTANDVGVRLIGMMTLTSSNRLLRFVVAATAVVSGVCLHADPMVAQVTYKPCPDAPERARCGWFVVPENRDSATGRTIRLNFMVLPATGDTVFSDPLVFLAGGGVVPATRYGGMLATELAELRRHRDIVLLDQRGTWNSQPLQCPPVQGPFSPVAVLQTTRVCRDSLSRHVNLQKFGTSDAVLDLEALRMELGYARLNLFGVSYGTKVAQTYLRAFPARVRTMTLRGVIPISVALQAELAASAQVTLERVFLACRVDVACNRAYPRLREELDELFERLAKGVEVNGGTGEVAINDRVFRNLLQAALGSSAQIVRVPFVIHAAHEGDYSSVLALQPGGSAPPAPRGVFLAIMCGEEMTRFDDAALARARKSFFGAEPLRHQRSVCEAWGGSPVAEDFFAPPRGATSALLISGELDGITRSELAARLLRDLPNARHVVIERLSHSDPSPCVNQLLTEYVLAGSAAKVDVGCAHKSPRLHFQVETR